MSIYRITYVLIACSFLVLTPSCKKTGKNVVRKITIEAAEKTAKEALQETSEKTLKSLTKSELRSIKWNKLLKIIRKDNINIDDAFSRLSSSFQKKIGKAIQTDNDFYSAFISSSMLLDEFSVFVKDAPKAANDINILKYFVKCRDLERRFGVTNALGDIAIKEEQGIIKLVNSADKSIIGELRNGILLIEHPFKSGSQLIDESSILKKTLIPNSVYKIKKSNGLSYLYHIDDLGRFTKIEAKGVSADELLSNVFFAKENLNLGSEWASKLKKVRQTSKGNDIDATIILKYSDEGTNPLTVRADIKARNKVIFSESFENLNNLSVKSFTTADNAKILNEFRPRVGLPTEKKADLLGEMGQNENLAKLIHLNPELNIRRWLNTRNHVDKSMVVRTVSGRMVPNGQVYAGNVYYFDPSLNFGLNARLNSGGGSINLKKFGSLTHEDLIKLDRLYPEGVPFSKEGFPDFEKVAFKDKNGMALKIDIKELSGDSKKDISLAETIFQSMGYLWEAGYTWHHLENSTSLIRVPTSIHQLVDHAGGMSTHFAEQGAKQAA